MAIFVEGQTERLFIVRLLSEIAGAKGLRIECLKASGGGRAGARMLTRVQVTEPSSQTTHFAMIVDCGSDNRVSSDIGDQYESLIQSGYTVIVGIRDVYPDFSFTDVPRLRNGLQYRLKTKPLKVSFVLGVMEIESWFLAEWSHFERLNSAITLPEVQSRFGFNPSTDDLQLRDHPALDLHNVYGIGGFAYKKSRNQVQRTVDILDYESLYIETSTRFDDLAHLISTMDTFLN